MPEFEMPQPPQPRVSPELLMGATSPLWGYYGAVAAGGVAYWWLTRTWNPANLEALFSLAAKAAEPAIEPIVEVAEVVAEVVADEPVMLVQAAEEAAAEAPPEPFAEAVASPDVSAAFEASPEPPAELDAPAEAAGKPRPRRTLPPQA